MNHNPVKVSRRTEAIYEVKYVPKKDEKLSKQKTERYLFLMLLASLMLMIFMLVYMVNEYLLVQNSSPEYLQRQYEFDSNQPFYRESADAYLKFVLRFIIIYGLISFFGVISFLLRKPWLYLLLILMTFISLLYFLLL